LADCSPSFVVEQRETRSTTRLTNSPAQQDSTNTSSYPHDRKADSTLVRPLVGVPVCVTLREEFTIVLNDVQSCGTLILIDVDRRRLAGGDLGVGDQYPGGSDEDCTVRRGRGDSAARGVTARLETGVAAQASRQHASLLYQPLTGCTV
jgi:hypothetical protein